MLADLSLLELIPALNPSWGSPLHLRDWCDLIEHSRVGGLRAMISIPYQHYKTTTTLCGVVWLLLRYPKLRILVITHSHEKAKSMGKDLRELWKLAGGETKKGFNQLDNWETPEGGGCLVMSAEQSRLGSAVDIVLVDDPIDENEWMLEDTRRKVDEAIALYTARAATHLDSVLIVASRWHPRDPIGLREARGWRYICHPGIIGYSEPPKGMPLLEHLERTGAEAFAPAVLDLKGHVKVIQEWSQVDPSLRSWWAQVQNNPLPDALGFFVGHTPYLGALPDPDGLTVWGVDLAFTSGVKADHAAFAGFAWMNDQPVIFEAIRHQRGLLHAVETLRDIRRRYPGCRLFTYSSGAEVGIYNAVFEVDSSLMVEQMRARFDKGYRAQKYAFEWRNKRIGIVMGQPWTGPFIAEHHAFDGSDKGIDDWVDAGTAAFDAMQAFRPAAAFGDTFTFGSPGGIG